MTTARLETLLDRVADQGRTLDLWWRDDDAVRDGPALRRLLRLSSETGCPLALAVIPACVKDSLVERLAGHPDAVDVLVHGFEHANHEPEGRKAAEFGPGRPLRELMDEARRALDLTRAAFGDSTLAVFVPPWNRVAPGLVPELPGLGYRGLSTFGGAHDAGRGLARVDAHLDPVDWRGSRGLVDPEGLAAALRSALASGARSIGLLTHHLVFDAALWDFVDGFLRVASRHPGVDVRSIRDLLHPAPGSATRAGRRDLAALEPAT